MCTGLGVRGIPRAPSPDTHELLMLAQCAIFDFYTNFCECVWVYQQRWMHINSQYASHPKAKNTSR